MGISFDHTLPFHNPHGRAYTEVVIDTMPTTDRLRETPSMCITELAVSPSQAHAYLRMEDSKLRDDCSISVDGAAGPGMATTAHPCSLSWSNLTFTVKTPRTPQSPDGTKVILADVTGRCAPGELLAVMGPSGSGKTTLLDVLADRVSSAAGTIDGTVEVNGEKRNTKTFRAVTSYVAQEEALLGSFSVVETLQMAAQLSLPSSVTSAMIERRVHAVIEEMGLGSCKNTLVGDVFHKGLSGGQKRRLSIAIELLSNPSILLLDEPTSGLDSSAAFNVIKFIKHLSETKKTVVCTIHQPSSLVYDMFSSVLILTGGQTVYCGARDDALRHFSSVGFVCPKYANPAEYFISLVNEDFESHGDIPALVTAFSNSTAASHVMSRIVYDRNCINEETEVHMETPSAWRQFWVLMHRNTLDNLRNPGIYWVRLFMYFMLSFMVGTMYLSTNKDISEEDVVALLFYIQAFLVFMSVAVLPFFIEQRAVFTRERANSSLGVTSYVLANFFAALPGIFVIATVSTVLVVFLADLNAFWWFLLNLFLSMVVAESMMHVIGAAVPHYIIGIALGAGVFGMFMLCEGFMIPHESIPDFWIWGYYMAFHSYSFESFVYEHFSKINSPAATGILARFGMEHVNTPRNMGVLACYALGFQIVFALILYKFHTGRR